MAEPDWANRRSRLERVRMRPIASSSSINGLKLHVHPHRSPDRGSNGCNHPSAHRAEQLEDQRIGENHQDIRHVARRCSRQLLHHLARHAEEQEQQQLRLDNGRPCRWLESNRMVLPLRLPSGFVDND